MVRRGLVADRDEARGLIARGRVRVAGAPADNPERRVAADEAVAVLAAALPYVGRGGLKLDAALERFAVEVAGRRALDAGASTGGFTDRLLQGGAASVVAVEVGRSQLHDRLRRDGRVDGRERTDVRDLSPDALGGPVDLLVADLSFVSLRPLLAGLVGLVRGGGDLVLLVKPQFEAERAEVDPGRGVVSDPAVWARSVVDVGRALEAAGAAIMDAMASPLRGAAGNVEFLLHGRVGAVPSLGPVEAARRAVAEVGGTEVGGAEEDPS